MSRNMIIAAVMAVLCAGFSTALFAEEWGEYEGGERGEHERYYKGYEPEGWQGGMKASNPLYQKECSGCHIAYPAKMLTRQSWIRIMDNLGDHFGDDATLSASTRQAIMAYLSKNSGGRGGKYADEAPLRITETRYFQREHREIPNRMVKGNPKVRSFANCAACHTGAEQGNFSEHGVRIPGVGRWED